MKLLLSLLAVASLTGCMTQHDAQYETLEQQTARYNRWTAEEAKRGDAINAAWVASWRTKDIPLFTHEGCYTIVLSENRVQTPLALQAGCGPDESYAAVVSNGKNGDARMQYPACYRKAGQMLELRLTDGKPAQLRSAVIRKPFPTAVTPERLPKSCKLNTQQYIVLPDHILVR
jgi:hypothetical protein